MKRSLPFRPSRRAFLAVWGATVASGAFAGPILTTPADKAVQEPTLYVVGYSHLDTQWCWSYPQVIREFIPNTLHENFALFDKYPDYVFNWTGSNRYRFMKEYYPEDYARLKKYVAAGRWFPAGSSVEEGDVNSPSEESLIRQVMYGNHFFRQEFGKASDEYMLPDCFGFPASLPSILAHCGVKGFSTQKLTWGSAVGIPFNVGRWIGPDGRETISAVNAMSYGSNIDDDLTHDPYWNERLAKDAQTTVAVDYRYYGVGDRGGSPSEGSVRNLEKSLHGDGPLHVVGGRADQMFDDLSPVQIAKLPTYKGDLELTQHSAGSLTSEAAMKRWNRKNEFLADDAEKASVAADWTGALPYDRARITDAWLRFLPGQFHDLMAGTALPVAYNYTWNDEILAMNEFADVVRGSVGGVARALDTRAQGVPIVVYNPLSIDREDVVEANVAFPSGTPKAVRVVGPDGREVPSQIDGRSGSTVSVLFLAKAPSVGFATYDVRPAAHAATSGLLRVGRNGLENARYRVKIDGNGDVSSVYDKQFRRELLSGPARLAYMHENPTQYPAWNMDWSDQSQPPRGFVNGPARIQVVENGPVRVALRVTREDRGSLYSQTIRLAAGAAGARVEFATKIDWQGKESALKAVFPLTVSNPKATYNWGLGTVQRGNDDPKKYEVASHEWFDVTDTSGRYGVSVLDDCKYGSDKPDDKTVRLTLLYTPGVRGGYQHQATQDWGRNQMLYALVGHSGDWRAGKSQWEAARLNQPLLAFQAPSHAGPLGRDFSTVWVGNPNVSVEAMKKAEDSDEVVVRLNELAGKAAPNVRLRFAAPVVSAREIDGQERPLGPARIQDGQLVVNMTAYRPRAFAIRLAKSRLAFGAPKSVPLALPYNLDAISTWARKTDGNFDGTGKSLPGELLPKTLVSDGVVFRLGPTADGRKNALVAQGQTLRLPAGTHRRLYLLAASAGGDTQGVFKIGRTSVECPIQNWSGFIGQWDNRLWLGKVPELTYDWHNPLGGLVPGYIKRAPVAWYADHRRLANGENDIYAFAYLFRYALPVPDGASAVTLPKNSKIRILAATVAENPGDDTRAAQPLYDTLADRANTAPRLEAPQGFLHDAVRVTIDRPLYWTAADTLHYTTDGSMPGAQSPVYRGPLLIGRTTVVKAVQIDPAGRPGPVASIRVNVKDTTPPSATSATTLPGSRTVQVAFSEPVDPASGADPAHYAVGAAKVDAVQLAPDGQSATLRLDAPLDDPSASLTLNGVADRFGNAASGTSFPLARLQPAFALSEVQTLDGVHPGRNVRNLPDLPTRGDQPWTLNMFVYMDAQPKELTILGGFGNGRDDSGAERYLIKYHDGIHFWGSSVDISAGRPFDLHRWQMVTVTYDGQNVRIYKDGQLLKTEAATLTDAAPVVRIAPVGPWESRNHFEGKIANLTIWPQALPADAIATLERGGEK